MQTSCGTTRHIVSWKCLWTQENNVFLELKKKKIQIYIKLAPHLLQELPEVQVAGRVLWSRTLWVFQCSLSKIL